MFRETGPAKLVDVYNRDSEGNPTTKKGRPEYVVMLTPEAFAAYDGALDAYVFTPDHYDDSWAGLPGQTPADTTVYLKFNTKAQCEAQLAAHLKDEE